MGFDVNFSNNKPMIQSAQSSQDGGAGNLGYFENGEKDGKNKSKDKSIFGEEGTDSFKNSTHNDEPQDDFSISRFIAQIILVVKDWFKKTFGQN